jgi:putative endonuclease
MGCKCIVYVLKATGHPTRYYTGITSDVGSRLEAHNAGRCVHTANARPWTVDVTVEFTDEKRALAFERYLKSGSGVAFAKRHLRSPPLSQPVFSGSARVCYFTSMADQWVPRCPLR